MRDLTQVRAPLNWNDFFPYKQPLKTVPKRKKIHQFCGTHAWNRAEESFDTSVVENL